MISGLPRLLTEALSCSLVKPFRPWNPGTVRATCKTMGVMAPAAVRPSQETPFSSRSRSWSSPPTMRGATKNEHAETEGPR
jgi:hypothetical protein